MIRIDDVGRARGCSKAFGGQPEQLGQRIVEVIAAGDGRRGGGEELAFGSIVKRSFARH